MLLKRCMAYLKLETVARGLGFTTTQNISGREYINIRWNRVDEYLNEIGFATCGKIPEYISENVFYRLAYQNLVFSTSGERRESIPWRPRFRAPVEFKI